MELRIDRVSKQYKNKIAVDRLSATLHTGVTGLLGANGAGKTTLMRMICGVLTPTSGEITYNGVPVSEERYRSVLGYLPQEFGCYPEFSGRDFLLYFAALKGMPRNEAEIRSEELLETVGLVDVSKKRVRTYSGGMKQRLGIAQALINRPRLLICDEPTSALDPVGRREILDILKNAGKQTSVFFSTHILTDVERICDKVAFLEGGKIALCGDIDEIRKKRSDTAVEVLPENPADAALLAEHFAAGELRDKGFVLRNASAKDAEDLMKFLLEKHISVIRFERKEPDLENMFMEVIGE